MCVTNILHSDSNGYVAHCPNCKHLQLAFDTFSINLLENDFEYFYYSIIEELKHCCHIIDADKKNFIYKLGPSSFRLVFSLSDLQRLYDLLSPARIIYNTCKITAVNSDKE